MCRLQGITAEIICIPSSILSLPEMLPNPDARRLFQSRTQRSGWIILLSKWPSVIPTCIAMRIVITIAPSLPSAIENRIFSLFNTSRSSRIAIDREIVQLLSWSVYPHIVTQSGRNRFISASEISWSLCNVDYESFRKDDKLQIASAKSARSDSSSHPPFITPP